MRESVAKSYVLWVVNNGQKKKSKNKTNNPVYGCGTLGQRTWSSVRKGTIGRMTGVGETGSKKRETKTMLKRKTYPHPCMYNVIP